MFKLLRILFFLLKGITKTIENETKDQKEGFLGMLLGTLGAGLLGNGRLTMMQKFTLVPVNSGS